MRGKVLENCCFSVQINRQASHDNNATYFFTFSFFVQNTIVAIIFFPLRNIERTSRTKSPFDENVMALSKC